MDSCGNKGITFTTTSSPTSIACFNITGLFGGNETQGHWNYTQSGRSGRTIIDWVLEDKDNYDPTVNYTHVKYQQSLWSSTSKKAGRTALFFDHEECYTDYDESWYGWDCGSDEGDCRTLPYAIESFGVVSASSFYSNRDNCWTFAVEGSAMKALANSRSTLAMVALVAVAIVFSA